MFTHTHLEDEEKLKCEMCAENQEIKENKDFVSQVLEVDRKVVGTAEPTYCQSRRQRAGFDCGNNSVGAADYQKVCLQSFEKSQFERAN